MGVRRSILAGVLMVGLGGMLLGSCANPVAPTGGPRDQTPPSIVKTRPVQDTVNVSTDTRSVYVEFSEYIERSTLTQSLSITPRFDGRLQYDWSGRGVEIELPSALRDSTTYILSFDNSLSDAREGVSLNSPITVAFSTGPRINQGELKGRVIGPRKGTPKSGVGIFAYGEGDVASLPPDSLPKQPTYRTQTGSDGTFSFDYLREQRYYVVALRDNNRNRQPDPTEPFAVPPHPVLAADSGSTEIPAPWLLTKSDTLAPQLRQVRARTRQRLRLTFTEPVRLADQASDAWTLRDSVTEAPVPVRAAYRPKGRANALVLRTAPMEPTRHVLSLPAGRVTDTLGRGIAPDTVRLQASARADTMTTRFQTFVPTGASPNSGQATPLLPAVHPGVRFNQAPDSSTLQAALALRDTAGQAQSYTLTTTDGRTYRFEPASPIPPGAVLEVTVDGRAMAGPDTTYRRCFRRVTKDDVGGLEGRAVLADTTHPAVKEMASGTGGARPDTTNAPLAVELKPVQSTLSLDPRTQIVQPGSTFVFENLPDGTFRFRAFLDRNANGRWDGGQLQPFRRAEPITWSASPTKTRLRWTNVLSAPLRVPLLRPTADSTALDSSAAPPE